jgi:hypothetical protein
MHPSFTSTLYPSPPEKSASSVLADMGAQAMGLEPSTEQAVAPLPQRLVALRALASHHVADLLVEVYLGHGLVVGGLERAGALQSLE